MEPSKNAPCPCGSGKKYKRCCFLTGGITIAKSGGYKKFNKNLNRYETNLDHHYFTFNYRGCDFLDSKPYVGKIKCRLVHEQGNSIIVPDFIFVNNGWIQPLHFTAPNLFKIDDDKIGCDFFIDIQNGQTIKVRFYNSDILKIYSDKSQLFKCEIYGPADIEEYTSGEFEVENNQIYLKLYHHTNDTGFAGITSSKSLRSSKWNYRGSKECTNFHFAYFTHIPEIKYSNDLITVAMSADGNIDYMIDSFIPPKAMPPNYRTRFENSIYTAQVYRSTTNDRNHPLEFYLPVESIDIKHIYLHNQGNLFFFEICFPYIHRLKLTAGSTLTFDDNHFIKNESPIVNSDYSIIGDARTKEGLAAPFEEEETDFIYKIEDCGTQTIHDFWFSHSNQDLFTDKTITELQVKDVSNNPTT
ncbi:YecA family protein [Sediminibacterium sp. TEGAF015]|uniref:YecA family protein n=1 Tax=Sediminibacterium sp. TEGAF015 TaxID=575378 RepID=UPI002209682A|nr:SEC-C metal-binding domain-containing protein [Sediminibacterium sp. TEGAF015]BDQ12110.1 hypothetical protein TEGAF0_13270 [Sediminibacterium sp. TEGAF015]